MRGDGESEGRVSPGAHPQGQGRFLRSRKDSRAASIGSAIATRAIIEDLRAGMDGVGSGPPPFSKADRSNFPQALDGVLVRLGRMPG